MKKFHFRFEALEKVRIDAEDQAKADLAAAQRQLQNEIQIKSGLLEKLSQSLERRESMPSEGTSPVLLKTEEDFIAGTKQRILQADHRIRRAQKRLSQAQAAYMEARKNRKIVEKIREKDHDQFKQDEKKREARELNDLYVMRSRPSELLK